MSNVSLLSVRRTMKHFFWLASVAACLCVGCAEPATTPTTTTSGSESTEGGEATFDFVKDADFEPLIASTPVVVANFTADW